MNRREAIMAAVGALLGGPAVIQSPASFHVQNAIEKFEALNVRNTVSVMGVLLTHAGMTASGNGASTDHIWIKFHGTIREVKAVLARGDAETIITLPSGWTRTLTPHKDRSSC